MIATESNIQVQEPLKLGFVGVGWIGRNRMEVLLKNSNSKAILIAEPSEENASKALKSAEDASIVEDLEQMLKDEEVDGIIIATPSAMHADQSIRALKAGKAVFCQKPLGRTAEEVKNVISASMKADKYLGVDFSYRYTRAFQAVHKLIKSGEIGEIFSVDLVFHNAYGPDKDWFYDIKRSGGGCVMDLGIHLVDLALWSLGFPEVTDVTSHLFHQGKKLDSFNEQVEDFASVNLTTAQGTVINLNCSWNISAGKEAEIEAKFFGTNGGAAFKNVNGSFYDFTAEKYIGTQTETLVIPPDDWSGKAGVDWAEKVLKGQKYDRQSANELIKTAEIIDRIYGR